MQDINSDNESNRLTMAKMAFAGLTKKERMMFMAELNQTPAMNTPSETRIIKRQEVARRLGYSTRLVDQLGAAGTLERVTLPGRQRGCGYRLSDVEKLIAGPN